MEASILKSVKQVLQVDPDYTAFDIPIIMHINAVFATLNELGIGPVDGFMIEDDTAEWGDFLAGEKLLNGVPTYVYLRVRLLFDPPPTAHALASAERQITELESRLKMVQEAINA